MAALDGWLEVGRVGPEHIDYNGNMHVAARTVTSHECHLWSQGFT
jgi:hypothetical protein